MVKVEPFIYQKMTAFRERIQMVDKINEMIEVLNDGIDPEEVRAIITEELKNYYDKAEIDEMFNAIDFSPYYTKTEVNSIVERIDGDVDAVEGRMNTAEGDIDALEGRMGTAEGDIDNLEANKQNNLTVGKGLSLANDKIDLSGWETVPVSEFNTLFEKESGTDTYIVKEDIIVLADSGTKIRDRVPVSLVKGMKVFEIFIPFPYMSSSSGTLPSISMGMLHVSVQSIISSSSNINASARGIQIGSQSTYCEITDADFGTTLTKRNNLTDTISNSFMILRRV